MERRRYRSFVSDSIRWDGFRFRPGDIVISTPPKCGTTWMQRLCSLLIFDSVELDRPMSEISPWLDMQTNDLGAILELLEAQEHRRFIKTHTPLDGLPFDEGVTYICVGRDPRDVSLSWDHHLANMDMERFVSVRAEAVGLDDLPELGPPPAPPAEDPVERFWQWADGESGPMDGVTLRAVLDHVRTFWDQRHLPNIALFHYGDLLADLPGQMARLAQVLGIELPADRIRELAAAATFDQMKKDADRVVPDVHNAFWVSNAGFFHRGVSGQWRGLLDDEGLRRYEQRVAALAPPEMAAWAHHGWLGAPAPAG